MLVTSTLAGISVLVLDFDGVVVVDSEFLKREAWTAVLAPYGARAHDAFDALDGEIRMGAIDRFGILDRIFDAISLAPAAKPAAIADAARQFDEAVQARIAARGLTDSERRALAALNKAARIFLNSATPEVSLARTIAALQLTHLFDGVFGRPTGKVENLARVSKTTGASPEAMLFVGDGGGDAAAAQKFGCRFIGFANAWNGWSQAPGAQPIIGTLAELAEAFAEASGRVR